MFEDFEEWFAIRNRHDEDDIWAGRLSFNEKKGISLEAIFLPKTGIGNEAPDCDKGTITGYLDYQRPTTIVEPWVQSQGGGSMGVDTPIVRAKSRMLASAVLKNIHLEDLNEKCFTVLYMDLPAFGSWYAPQLVKTDYEHSKENRPPEVSVEIDSPSHEEFILKDKTNVIIDSFVGTSEDENTTKVTQRTSLTFEFHDAIDYSTAQKWIWRVNILFSFLLGHRMAQNPYQLKTTHTRKWNEREDNITAELFFRPVFKSQKHHVQWYDALFMRRGSALTPKNLLNSTIEQSDALFYLMNMVLSMENPEKLSASDFGELIGCIEDFDIKNHGSGSSSDVTHARRALRKIVKAHGTEDDLQTLDDLAQVKPNRLSLAERLDRLQQEWSDSGFRGEVDTSKVIKIRNNVSHGRGVELSSEDYQEIVWLNYHICALSRFHIFRTLGIQDKEIASAFGLLGFRYGKYAPVVPKDS